jgi:hypothetical protein
VVDPAPAHLTISPACRLPPAGCRPPGHTETPAENEEKQQAIIMSTDHVPGLGRRRFLTTTAGAGAVAAAGLTACVSAGPARAAAASPSLADAVLKALTTHRLVALGAADSLQNHYDLLELLLTDPRLPATADIIVEWGNSLYQDTIDKFTAGQPVADADLRPVWRSTTQSPLETCDAPVYEQFYRLVRAVNSTRPASQRIRVLAGDSPIDWAKITKPGQLRDIPPRDSFVASLVRKQVLAPGRRALLCYGMTGLFHGTGMTEAIEQGTGQRIYVIADLVPLAGDPGGLARRLSRYPRNTVIPAAGTWLGSFNAGLFVSESSTAGKNPFCGVRLGTLIDAGLYPGQPAELTATWPDPDIYYYPPYCAELHRRNALTGNRVDLAQLRQEHPARYPLTPSRGCGKTPQANS